MEGVWGKVPSINRWLRRSPILLYNLLFSRYIEGLGAMVSNLRHVFPCFRVSNRGNLAQTGMSQIWRPSPSIPWFLGTETSTHLRYVVSKNRDTKRKDGSSGSPAARLDWCPSDQPWFVVLGGAFQGGLLHQARWGAGMIQCRTSFLNNMDAGSVSIMGDRSQSHHLDFASSFFYMKIIIIPSFRFRSQSIKILLDCTFIWSNYDLNMCFISGPTSPLARIIFQKTSSRTSCEMLIGGHWCELVQISSG